MDSQTHNNSSPSKLPVGYLIGDRFIVQEFIGSGASGTVYKCTDTTLGTLSVAVKIFPKWVSTDKRRAKRIHRELRACYRINHDNVVRFYDTFYDDNVLGYSMEYVNGKTLDSLVETSGINDFGVVIGFLRQILLGVHSIHSAGIVHRDLKPENIIVSKDGILKVADFGLVSSFMEASDSHFSTIDKSSGVQTESLKTTGSGHIVGTPAYMAPEAVKERSYDTRSDLYAVGIIGYELLTGNIPFENLPCSQLLLAKVELEAPRVETLRPDCPIELSEFINKLISRDPNLRFSNARESLHCLAKIPNYTGPIESKTSEIFKAQVGIKSSFDKIFDRSDKGTYSIFSEVLSYLRDFDIQLEWVLAIFVGLLALVGVLGSGMNSSSNSSDSSQYSGDSPLDTNSSVGKSRFFGPQSSQNKVIVVKPSD